MAVPSYTTDLTLISNNDANTSVTEPGTWTALSAQTSGETDYFIQGSACTSATVKTGLGGLVYNNGAGITIPTDGAVLVWVWWGAPNSLEPIANGGIRTIIGNLTTAFTGYAQGGSDTYTYGGWINLATGSPASVTADYTVGSPNTTYQYFGWAYNAPTNVPTKGNPYAIDAIRYGRCEARFANGAANADGSATFGGFAAQNDTVANRWGLIQAISGAYLWKGLMVLGYVNPVYFVDSNQSILIDNTRKVTSGFNKIEVRQATSNVNWTAISFQALGTVSRGNFECVDNADVNITSCTFTDMGTFIFKSGSTILTSTFRRCGQITAGNAIFTTCTFDSGRDAATISANTLDTITKCSFTSDGTNHAVDLGTVSATTSMSWDNTLTNYASSDGSTGNEAIKVNVASGQTLTINVQTGATTPSVYNTGTGSITKVTGTVTASLKVVAANGANISSAAVLVKAAAGGGLPANVTVTIVNTGSTANVTHTAHGMLTGDKVQIRFLSDTGKVAANEGIFAITKISNDNYNYTMASSPGSSPTGTIKATYVLLSGTTDTNGDMSMSRSFGSNQPVTGWARKSTSAPYYKQGAINGTVTTGSGATLTAVLVADE